MFFKLPGSRIHVTKAPFSSLVCHVGSMAMYADLYGGEPIYKKQSLRCFVITASASRRYRHKLRDAGARILHSVKEPRAETAIARDQLLS